MNLIEQVKLFPSKPGVYIMKDSLGNIIYVGKAKKLKNRVMQYFYHIKDRAPKINAMVDNIHSIEYILTDTELEAFLTECRLIKEIKPRYNSQMKNDSRYAYIKISINEKYPGISVVTNKDETKDETGSLFFGPYTSQSSVERTVSFIKENFLIRKCSNGLFKRSTGCLNYSLGTCMGVCRGDSDDDAYRKCVNNVVLFLEGKDDSIIESLTEKINLAADRLEFEKAAKYRDDLIALKHILNKQSLIRSSSKRKNVVAIEATGRCRYKIFLFKGNRLITSKTFSAENTDRTSAAEYLYNLITDNFKNKNVDIGEILTQQEIDEAQIIYSYLKQRKNDILSFRIPANWLADGNPKLKTEVDRIVGMMYD
mgnify:CR=1 FL=1